MKQNKIIFNKIRRIIGISILFGVYIVFLYIFINAYLNGHRIMVNVNYYNEANLELIMFLITLPLVIHVVKEYVDGIKKMR